MINGYNDSRLNRKILKGLVNYDEKDSEEVNNLIKNLKDKGRPIPLI